MQAVSGTGRLGILLTEKKALEVSLPDDNAEMGRCRSAAVVEGRQRNWTR